MQCCMLKQRTVTVLSLYRQSASPCPRKTGMEARDLGRVRLHSKNIRKHKNDVFRLTELIDPAAKITAPNGVYADIQEFAQRMQNESVDIKQLGLTGRTKDQILEEVKDLYTTE